VRPASPLLLLLAGCIVLMGPVQRVSLLNVSLKLPVLAGAHCSPRVLTREEVSDKGLDFSTDARCECARSIPETAPPLDKSVFDDAEVEVSPLRRLLHRRISPAAPDDAFHLA
jgi:hypothetical protein